MIREDLWDHMFCAFGKEKIKLLLSEHPLKDGIFLNKEEKSYVYKFLTT